jgi:endonuclease/exonuclease/phosphatase family metal-dependent hydrolase
MIVVTWNMAHRNRAWGHLLDGLAPDLALLQETAWRADDLSSQVVYAPAHGKDGTPYPWGSAVYVRGGTTKQLPLPAEHQGWLVATEVQLGQDELVAVSVHAPILPTVRPNLDRAFEALEPMLAGRSFVVGGDLNLSRNYDKYYGPRYGHAEFLDGLPARGFFDCMRKFHAEEKQTIWKTGSTAVYQDDHIFVSEDLAERVTACDVADHAGLSDHSPLALTLEQPVSVEPS